MFLNLYKNTKYSDELKRFKSKKENQRSNNCYLAINLINDDIYIGKNWHVLYETLKTSDVLDSMVSSKSIDFNKMNNLKNYADSCLNYYVKKFKIPLN